MKEIGIKNESIVSREKGLQLLYQMTLIRRFEEKAAEMYSKSKIRGFLHLYIGEEAVAVGVIDCLKSEDNIFATYREHGQALARGIESKLIMAEMYGKQEGCSKGRGGSMHLFDAKKKFYGGNAIVAGHLPMAVGMALASKKQKRNDITCCFFGEGAVAEGAFHESMNLAALWQVPLLMICENNLYAMGTAIQFTHSMQDLERKGDNYGIKSTTVDGMDLSAIMKAAREAIDFIHTTGKPYFLVCNTYRFRAHSMFDPELYRNKSEVEEWKKRDPIPNYQKYLITEKIISDSDLVEMENKIETEIQQTVDFAESGTIEPIEELSKYVYSN